MHLFQKDDIVKILPNKGFGRVTSIDSGFVILDHNKSRPYMSVQLKLIRRKVKDFYPLEVGTKFVSGTLLYEVEFDNIVYTKLIERLENHEIVISKDKDIKGLCTAYKTRKISNGRVLDMGLNYYDMLMVQQVIELMYGGKEIGTTTTSS